jgi:hypothetical protein
MIRSKAYYSWAKREYQYQTTLMWLKLILHLGILLCLSLGFSIFAALMPSGLMPVIRPIVMIGIGWLSVEIHDYIWLNYYRQIKIILSALSSGLAFLGVAVALVIYVQGSGEGSLLQTAQNWHQQVNQDLQRNSAAKLQILGAPRGENWSFVLNSQNQPELITTTQVRSICQTRVGAGWRLPKTNELSSLKPYPSLSSHTYYIWAINKRDGVNLNVTSLSQVAPQSGQAFVSYSVTDVFPALCVQGLP